MTKIVTFLIMAFLFMASIAGFVLYYSEGEKVNLMRVEGMKTAEQAREEAKTLKEQIKEEKERGQADKQKVLEQVTAISQERDTAIREKDDLKKQVETERRNSFSSSGDIDKLRQEIVTLRTQNKEGMRDLDAALKKKIRSYEARILSLEQQLTKAKERYTNEADRYHYNLAVVYTQNKDYESAVREYNKALDINPRNAQAHYNLGIIYDDYFKDKVNAELHYRAYLELDPVSDDAEAVREWLTDLEKK